MRNTGGTDNIFDLPGNAEVIISNARQSVQNGAYAVDNANSTTVILKLFLIMRGVDANLPDGNEDRTMRIALIED